MTGPLLHVLRVTRAALIKVRTQAEHTPVRIDHACGTHPHHPGSHDRGGHRRTREFMKLGACS